MAGLGHMAVGMAAARWASQRPRFEPAKGKLVTGIGFTGAK
jgi:hypothetical protein